VEQSQALLDHMEPSTSPRCDHDVPLLTSLQSFRAEQLRIRKAYHSSRSRACFQPDRVISFQAGRASNDRCDPWAQWEVSGPDRHALRP
jgi:hypothetical protein